MATQIFSGVDGASPAVRADAVTPNNNADLGTTARGVYVGGAGNLKVLMAGDSSPVTFVAVNAGSILPIQVVRIYSTGTTATNILVLR